MGPEFLQRLEQQITSLLPPSMMGAREELHRNLGAILQQAFSRLDLVSREEFETQQAVLLRTREKLELLEKKLTELEQQA